MGSSAELGKAVFSGQRRALAKAITLVESMRPDHRAEAIALLDDLRARGPRSALRIGLSGTPGVGKSTFIEAFGLFLVSQGLKVAVLAVDPSSTRSGGSILGDKTRMEHLSREKNAFIRPSPSQTNLGGVARRTREAILLCEAAGYDVVLVETVGVGQSETMVAQMTDIFLLLLAPAGGDELQGVKRGIMEIADIILVNKADGELKSAAVRTCADYAGALRLLRKRDRDPAGYPMAQTISATEGTGVAEAWAAIRKLEQGRREMGVWEQNRNAQNLHWFEAELQNQMLAEIAANPHVSALIKEMRRAVERGERQPPDAAARILRGLEIRSRGGD